MIRSILAALDGSERAPGVFSAAAEVASRFGARIYALRVVLVPPEFPPSAAGMPADPLAEALHQRATDELAQLVRQRPDLVIDPPIVREGQAWRGILEAAETFDVDLIVIGSHGYHGWDRILGTTAAKVANLARRNVLVVHGRAEGKSDPSGPGP
jgi:nucleotide-binding universal stress UspA family protein